MNRTALFAASAFTLAALTSTSAQAAGTLAGTEITTSALVSYDIGTITQAPITVDDKLTVDRVIRFTVQNLSGPAQSITPGQTNVITTIRITNQSNAPVSFGPWYYIGPWVTNPETNPVMPANINRFYVDSNNNGMWDPASDLQIDYSSTNHPVTDPDTTVTWFTVVDIPTEASAFNGQTINASVWVNGGEPNTSGNTAPAYFWETAAQMNATTNTAGVETVLTDEAQSEPFTGSYAKDGEIIVPLSYIIKGASLTVNRLNTVISDAVNGTNNPKVIPGATVEYCVAISNAAGGATASNIAITDTLGSNLTYDSAFGIYQDGTVTGGVCDTAGAAGGTSGGTFANGKVTGTISSIAAGETRTIRYRATVN